MFSRACSTDADCAFDIVRVFPCDRAAIGFRADDATAFGAYRDDCVAAFSNYAGRDAGQCVSQGDDLLTDDGQRRLMGTIANVSVQCRAAVCTTTYR